jgi:hypothetical protein
LNEFSANYVFNYLNLIRATAGYTLSFDVKVKVKVFLEQVTKAQRGSTLSLTSALDGVGWSTPRPGRFTRGKGAIPIV